MLYKKSQMIGSEYYVVEISYNQRGLFISLFSLESADKNKVLEVEDQEKCRSIMESFENDYEKMAKHVRLVRGQIKIRKPKMSLREEEDEDYGVEASSLDYGLPAHPLIHRKIQRKDISKSVIEEDNSYKYDNDYED